MVVDRGFDRISHEMHHKASLLEHVDVDDINSIFDSRNVTVDRPSYLYPILCNRCPVFNAAFHAKFKM